MSLFLRQCQRPIRLPLVKLLCCLMLIFFVASRTLVADIVIFNDDMSDPDYAISFTFTGVSAPHAATFIQIPTGGNPNEHLEVLHTHNGNGLVTLQSTLLEQSTTYTPSVNGFVTQVSFSIDLLFPEVPGASLYDEVYFVLSDANGVSRAGYTTIIGQQSWQTVTVTGLTEANFSGIDFEGSLPVSAGFGFVSTRTNEGPINSLINVDNFVVSVVQVPEPNIISLWLMFSVGILGQRRRV